MTGATTGPTPAAPGLRRRLRRAVHRVAAAAEGPIDRVVRAVRPRRPRRIQSYGGHASERRAVLRARVLDGPPIALPSGDEPAHRSIGRMVRRFLTREVGGVAVVARVGGTEARTLADDEGHVRIELTAPVTPGAGWVDPSLRVADDDLPPGTGPVSTTVELIVPHADADVGVISDLDDTVILTGAARVLTKVRTTLTGTFRTRTAFPGVADLYRALAEGPGGVARPFFYVSASPWNLHDFLDAFLRHHRIPPGPLFLTDAGLDERLFVSPGHAEHKLAAIDEILGVHHRLRFVLVGDTGQHDADIYADAVDAHPGRVVAVMLRDVGRTGDLVDRSTARLVGAGVPVCVTDSTDAMTVFAGEVGLLPGAEPS